MAVFIIAASAIQLLKLVRTRGGNRRRGRVEDTLWPYYVLLVVGGTIHGMFSSVRPLRGALRSRALPEKGAFRATLTLLWTTLNTVLIALYLAERRGYGGRRRLYRGPVPLLAGGIAIGERLHSGESAVFSA
jgi:hypothetical protein